MNILRLLSWHTDVELQDDDEETEEDDLPAVEWTRQRVPTDQERQTYDEGLRRHVAHLSAVVDPFRPRLQPRLSRQVMPETAPPRTALRLTTEAPTSAGFYLMRSRPGQPWQVVEIIADVHGDLWYGWGSIQPACRVGGSRLQWCQPALGSVPG